MATCPTCRTHYDDSTSVCAKDGAKLLPDEAFSSVDTDLQADTAVGEYRIERKLGEGGFGTVYRARHPLIGKTAAIKVLAREFSAKPEIVARFIDEARAVNQIRHKGIVDIFAFGTLPDGRHYFVMELLEGAPLDSYLRDRGRIPVSETIAILRTVARAVDAAHQAGIAHRDLKPDNVFLVNEDEGVRTKLLDFGVAKLLGEQSGRTRTGTPIGTPQYMSPEQSRGVNVDTRTDVYSFGAMAYEMLTGRVPFEGATIMDTLMKQISEQPAPPSSVFPELPSALDAPILHMLEKDPEKRPRTLVAAVDELAEAALSAGIAVASPSSVAISGAHPQALARTVPATPPVVTPPPANSAKSLIGSSAEVQAAPPPRRAPWIAIAAVIAVAGAAVVAFKFLPHQEPRTAQASTPVASSAPPAPTQATAASGTAAPTEVAITIDATPKDAQVFQGTRPLGAAPGPFSLPKAPGTTKLTVKATGYAPRDVEVETSTDARLPVALTPVAKTATTAAGSSPTHATAKPISTELANPY